MPCRRTMQTALRVQNVLPPGLIKAYGDLVLARAHGLFAGQSEAPRPHGTWTTGQGKGVIMERGRQCGRFPGAGIEMNLMPVGNEAPGQIRTIRAAAAA